MPSLEPAEIPPDHQECGICDKNFNSLEDTDVEYAVLLPCGHIIGRQCLAAWICPSLRGNNNTCPYCRRELFEKPLAHTVEGWQAVLDLSDWLEQTTTHPMPHLKLGRGGVRILCREITEFRVGEAYRELGVDSARLKERLESKEMDTQHHEYRNETGRLELRQALITIISDKVEIINLKRWLGKNRPVAGQVGEYLQQSVKEKMTGSTEAELESARAFLERLVDRNYALVREAERLGPFEISPNVENSRMTQEEQVSS